MIVVSLVKTSLISDKFSSFLFIIFATPELLKLKVKSKIYYDKSKPDGMPIKCLDISLAKKYGWKPNSDLNKALDITYRDFLNRN